MRLRQKALAFFTVLLLAASNGFGAISAAAAGAYSNPSYEFGKTSYQPYVHDKGYLGTRYSPSGHDTSCDFTLAADTPVWEQNWHEYDFDDLVDPVLRYVSVKNEDNDYFLYEKQAEGFAQVVPDSTARYIVTESGSGGFPRVQVSLNEGERCDNDIENVALFFSGTPCPGRITLMKAFASSGDPDRFFDFTVYGPDPATVFCNTSLCAGDADGVTVKVPYGTYYIQELAENGYKFVSFDVTPADYGTGMVSADMLKVDVGGGWPVPHKKSYTVTCTNRQLGSLRVIKTDTVTLGPVEGAQFHITGPGYDETPATDASGSILLENLEPGDSYTVAEVSAPENYRINDTEPRTQVIEAGGTASFEFADDPIGWIKVVKADADNHENLLDGAVFEVADNAGFESAVTLPATSSGHATSPALKAGHWWVREVTPPAGYVKDGAVREVDVVIGQTAGVVFYDPRDEGDLRVVKLSALTGEPVQGVTFELMDKDPADPGFGPGNILASAQTGAEGSILFADLPTGGAYWVRETASAPGYGFDPGVVKHAVIVYNQAVELIFENSPEASVAVVKTDTNDPGIKLAGAVYCVYSDAECTTLAQTLPPTDENGEAVSGPLPFGPGYPEKYYVKELSAPEGYLVSDTVFEVNFTEPGQTLSLAVSDVRNEGAIAILKVDALDTSKALAGAEFTLYSDEALTTQVGSAVTTGADGIAFFGNLAPGAYWLKETKAPEDYKLLDDPLPVTVTAGVTQPDPIVLTNQYDPDDDIPTGTANYTMALAGGGIVIAGGLALLAAWLLRRKIRAK